MQVGPRLRTLTDYSSRQCEKVAEPLNRASDCHLADIVMEFANEGLMPSFEALISEAQQHPTQGWDFSWLDSRLLTTKFPWDFRQIVDYFAKQSPTMLDLGTGGGEWLADLPHRPPHTVATEAWLPNVPIATERLKANGVEVVKVDPAPDNNRQIPEGSENSRLPFLDCSFHLAISRHESFVAKEVARILDAGATFVTEQIGDGLNREFCELFHAPVAAQQPLSLAMVVSQVEMAGLKVSDSQGAYQTIQFADVGALAWYLRMVPWTVPGFSISKDRTRLAELHARMNNRGPLTVHLPGFYLVAVKQ